MKKRILSILLTLCVLCSLLPNASADQMENTIQIPVQVNPLYADVVDPSEIHVPHTVAVAANARAAEYLPTEEAVQQIREHMKAREETFTIHLSSPEILTTKEEIQALVIGLFNSALEHTGNPLEGDYLKWQYGSWNGSLEFGISGSTMQLDITYIVDHYTTAQQEAELDAAVDSLLTDLGLENACDYEKLSGIYNHIIQNVTYDNENLAKPDHKLKYTAYAALINGTAVCQGYAVLLYRLALEWGIDARLIHGDTNGDGQTDHAWNIVKLKDVYYNADSTWDANIGFAYYFLMGDESFVDHTRDAEFATGEFYAQYPMATSDHTLTTSEWVLTKEATCAEDGIESRTCAACGETTTRTIPATGHNWDNGIITREPTDTSTGIRTYTCSVCQDTRQEEIPMLEHVHRYYAVTTAPTCTEEGYTTYTCACGDSYTDDEVAALGHSWDNGIVTKEPTETVDGIRTYACGICNETKQETIPALGHTHNYSAAVTLPTCTEKGYTTYTCACGDVYTGEEVSALGHAYSDGTCTLCGAADPEFSAPEHTHSYGPWITVTEPTGTTQGLEVRSCGCGAEEHRVIPILSNPFTDVKSSDYYYDSVLWASNRGITSGMSPTEFGPKAACTRAHIVTFLYRANGEPEPMSAENPFVDVKESDYFYKAVLWAVEKGITAGMDATHFAPNATCTRGQAVTFLYRASGTPQAEVQENPFRDVGVDDYYYHAVLWALENGITAGMDATHFGPTHSCTRGQIVTFLYRNVNQTATVE